MNQYLKPQLEMLSDNQTAKFKRKTVESDSCIQNVVQVAFICILTHRVHS